MNVTPVAKPHDTKEADLMVSHCKDKYRNDFTEACRWLRSKDTRHVFYNTKNSTRKAHLSSHDDTPSKDTTTGTYVNHLAFYISQLLQPILMHDTLNSMWVVLLTHNDSHYLAPAIWSQLTLTSKQDIL
jgi:hypothetical protein